jgi:hypothetical protein
MKIYIHSFVKIVVSRRNIKINYSLKVCSRVGGEVGVPDCTLGSDRGDAVVVQRSTRHKNSRTNRTQSNGRIGNRRNKKQQQKLKNILK